MRFELLFVLSVLNAVLFELVTVKFHRGKEHPGVKDGSNNDASGGYPLRRHYEMYQPSRIRDPIMPPHNYIGQIQKGHYCLRFQLTRSY